MTTRTSPTNPPLVKGTPILGNVPEMAKDPGQFFYRAYREYGPMFQIKIFNKKYKVMAGPEAAHFMGSKDGRGKLRSKEFWDDMTKEYGAKYQLTREDGLLTLGLRSKIFSMFWSRDNVRKYY